MNVAAILSYTHTHTHAHSHEVHAIITLYYAYGVYIVLRRRAAACAASGPRRDRVGSRAGTCAGAGRRGRARDILCIVQYLQQSIIALYLQYRTQWKIYSSI